MTDRVSGFIVVFEKEMREEGVDNLINALSHIRGVISVKPVVDDLAAHLAQQRIKSFLIKEFPKLYTDLIQKIDEVD